MLTSRQCELLNLELGDIHVCLSTTRTAGGHCSSLTMAVSPHATYDCTQRKSDVCKERLALQCYTVDRGHRLLVAGKGVVVALQSFHAHLIEALS